MTNSDIKSPRAKHDFIGRTCSISAVGSYVPEKVLTNADLEKRIDTTDEWITTRTGIKERRIAADDEHTSDMAAHAAQRALERADVDPADVDLIILATITPDMPFPATACLVQEKLGAHNAAAFDIEAACSGFVYALEIGQQFIMSRTYDIVLVIGAEKLSSIMDWEDRNTCVLFGDGAGAAVLQNRENSHGLLTACMGADGRKSSILSQPGGGCLHPATAKNRFRPASLSQDGRKGCVQKRRQRDGHRRPRGLGPVRARDRPHQVHHPAPSQHANPQGRRRPIGRARRPSLQQPPTLW